MTEVYGSDCTPIKHRKRIQMAAGGLCIRREGTDVADWLAERCFLVASNGERIAVFFEPRRLTNKTAWCHYQAWMELRHDLRASGHDAMVHRHFVYDRAICEPLFRYQCQFFHAEYIREQADRGEARACENHIKTFNTVSECFNHDCHSALEWAIKSVGYGDRDTLRYAFVAVESLRQGYIELVKMVPSWAVGVLRFETIDYDRYLGLWRAVGVDPKLLGLLIELQFRFVNGYLVVADRWRENAALDDSSMKVFIGLWSWCHPVG